MISYHQLTRVRRVLLLAAWCVVLCAMFFVVNVHTHTLGFRPGEADYAGWLVVLTDFVRLLFDPANDRLYAEDTTKYHLLVLAHVLVCVAHLCFLLTPIAVLVKPQSWAGKFFRYAACLLILFWSYPILNHFHPLAVGIWQLKDGFSLMGAGYMLAMVAIWINPKHPEARTGFPVG